MNPQFNRETLPDSLARVGIDYVHMPALGGLRHPLAAGETGGMMAGIVVDRVYERRLAALVNSREQRLIARGRRGLERESLRVTPDEALAYGNDRAAIAYTGNPRL